jgi:hypothetical protein
MTITTHYPNTPITPSGAWRMSRSDKPWITYLSYDESIVFDLMGPLAAPFHDRSSASISLVDIKGLVPPWKAISQKGATQDGESFVTALYDPLEGDLVVEAAGKTVAETNKVISDWIASWDAIEEGELACFTPKEGYWWVPVRWAKNPVDSVRGGTFLRQKLTMAVKSYDAFWRTWDNVDTFQFGYRTASDEFTDTNLNTLWDIAYSGPGTGTISGDGTQVVSTMANRTAVARRRSFTTGSDNEVVEITFGSFPAWSFDSDAYDDIWFRMKNTGTPGTDGMRMRVGNHFIGLSVFVGGVETVLRQRFMLIPPLPWEKWRIICGQEDNPRHFIVQRGLGITVPGMDIVESGTTSQLGSGFRSVGFGMHAGGGPGPAGIRAWNVGDNATITQSGFLTRTNIGDQKFFDRYTCFGPGTFSFANGPGSNDYVTFGPLLPNQVMQIRTDPSKRGVVDLTSTPNSPQAADLFTKAIEDFISFATGNNVPPLIQAIESIFGIVPPQGNPYTLLHGRFSDDAAIPAKSPGMPAQPYHVKVSIDNGNAASRILAAGTPLRRFPF